jgi:tight adherence protein B
MLLIVLAIFVGIFTVAILLVVVPRTGSKNTITTRLAALDQEFAPAGYDEEVADIRRAPQTLTSIPLLNNWLTKMNLDVASSRYLYQANVTVSLGALLLTSVACFALLSYILFLQLGALLPAVALSAGSLPMPFLYVKHKRAKRLSAMEQQLPDALGMMVSALRVGHSLTASLGAVAQESPEPIAGELRKCFEEQSYGVDSRTALLNLTTRAPIQDIRIFVAAVLIQKESGGNLAEVLENVAQTTRERFRLKKQISVHTAQGRMTGWILSLLPVALGVGMYFVNPDGMSILWRHPTGLKMLYIASAMDITGGLIIRKLVNIRV